MRILTAMVRDGPWRSVASPWWVLRGRSVAGPWRGRLNQMTYSLLTVTPTSCVTDHHATPPLNMYIEFGSCLQTLHRISELISFADNRSSYSTLYAVLGIKLAVPSE